MIGDLHTAAMVSRAGSVDWLCLPRFDRRPASRHAGRPSRTATGPSRRRSRCCTRSRRYRPDTLILETEFATADRPGDGLDFMPPRDEQRRPRADRARGSRARVEFGTGSCDPVRLRPGHPVGAPRRRRHRRGRRPGRGVRALGRATDRARTTRPWRSSTCRPVSGSVSCSPGRPSHHDEPPAVDATSALADTERYWRDWLAGCRYAGRWPEQVRRSLITLKALTYRPTGGIVAAATTSLPEQPGGPRNWDYRYCWLRDSTFTLEALVSCGYTDEAAAWRHWLLRAVGGDPSELQVLYTVDGAAGSPSSSWTGWPASPGHARCGSATPRPGSSSSTSSARCWTPWTWPAAPGITEHPDRTRTADRIDSAWPLQRLLLEAVAAMLAATRRRAVGDPQRAPALRALEGDGVGGLRPDDPRRAGVRPARPGRRSGAPPRDAIHAEVCSRRASTRPAGTSSSPTARDRLDAALLLLPRVGFLPWDDPRIVATVRAVAGAATDEPGSCGATGSPRPDGRATPTG